MAEKRQAVTWMANMPVVIPDRDDGQQRDEHAQVLYGRPSDDQRPTLSLPNPPLDAAALVIYTPPKHESCANSSCSHHRPARIPLPRSTRGRS